VVAYTAPVPATKQTIVLGQLIPSNFLPAAANDSAQVCPPLAVLKTSPALSMTKHVVVLGQLTFSSWFPVPDVC
jgi:hypothetical protein